jgi:hypothetical protein
MTRCDTLFFGVPNARVHARSRVGFRTLEKRVSNVSRASLRHPLTLPAGDAGDTHVCHLSKPATAVPAAKPLISPAFTRERGFADLRRTES